MTAPKENTQGIPGPDGVVLDQYVLREKLCTSRTGLIFKAQHRLTGQVVAVKFLSDDAAGSAALTARFHRAIQILARLQHRNLVKAIEAGEEDGKHYLVMEYVDGQDLRSIIKERKTPLGVEEAVRYAIQAAAGLAAVHKQGVCHRNVKPGNILRDREGLVKIVGFTLAHVQGGGAAAEAGVEDNLTRQGQVMGTYEYMSPEQAMDSSSVDCRADIYSLACTLHMLLTGRPPYVTKPGMQQVIAHRTQPIPSLRAARPEVPAALDRVFQKMMAKTPGDRYTSMEEVAAELAAGITPAPAIEESSSANLRLVIGLPAGPTRSGAAETPVVKPKARPAKRGLPMLPIVVGGVLAVGAVVFAVQYFQSNSVPKVVAKSADPHKAQEPAGSARASKPTSAPAQVPAAHQADREHENVAPKPDPLTEPAPVRSKETSTATAPAKDARPVFEPEAAPKPEPETRSEPKPPEPEKKLDPTPNASRIAVPDEAAHGRAVQLLQETYHDDLAKARSNVQKASVAQAMLRQARSDSMEKDPAGRFVLLETSCTLAKEANDPATALETIDLTARCYLVDGWLKKTELLAEMADGAKTLADHRALVEQVLPLVQKAVDEQQIEIAARLGELAVAEAGKAREPKLLARARAAANQSDQALTQFRRYQAAKVELQKDPGSAEANLAAGRYECLVRGDWERGLPKLAAGSDQTWRELAKKDLAAPADAGARAAVGDGWWELAKEQSGVGQAQLQARAAAWYAKALPQAIGLLKIKLEKRLADVNAAAKTP